METRARRAAASPVKRRRRCQGRARRVPARASRRRQPADRAPRPTQRSARMPAPRCGSRTAPQDVLREQRARRARHAVRLHHVHEIPTIEKIGSTAAWARRTQPKLLDIVVEELALITGQKPVRRKAKKACRTSGCRGPGDRRERTMRGARCGSSSTGSSRTPWPRIRDFRGLGTKSFDGVATTRSASRADDLRRSTTSRWSRSTAWTSRSGTTARGRACDGAVPQARHAVPW